MHEVITISVGPHANNIVTHFNNLQEDKLYLAPSLAQNPIDPNVHMEPVAEGSSYTFYPRTIHWEYQNGYGALAQFGAEDIDKTGYEVVEQPRVEKNKYQELLDSAQPTKSVLETDKVRYWTDFTRVLYKPRGLLSIRNWEYDYKSQTGFLKMHPERKFEGYDVGAAEYKNQPDFVDETLRQTIERCDLVNGMNLVTEVDSAWGGFSDELLADIRDEYAKTSVLTWSLTWDTERLSFERLVSRIRASVGLMRNSSLYLPLSTTPPLPKWADAADLWHVSSLQCIPLEFVNGLFAAKPALLIADFVNGLSTTRGQNVVWDITAAPHVFSCRQAYGNKGDHFFAQTAITRGVATKVDFSSLVTNGTSARHCVEYRSSVAFNSGLDSFPAAFSEEEGRTPGLCTLGVTNAPRSWFKHMAALVSRHYRGDEREELKNELETMGEQYVWGYESDDDY
ncbi:hypothetical protein KL918_000104 [Ogataea parapolymorpha]|uniref:Protein DML1 n=1 Tax=Ogataea parapolymorpha (strain ATCC 26012 / BCRC 20466 / JCM 22074 / NRRL Y-7560 / DL-1) TaxID=871575 RepID=W1Q864_OGAPD|nr:Protein dml1 [Ogataea parapolymorpha DL-1]ESW96156.1 Protein dml1 [Ogataea parapolymorpha DL-1]KAG7869900.1 hypothetical protein KL918_000104 [Ogataea parapolymorpha]KAG7873188.1 hypothetical protein KL916_002489 [Ogataea parapolymorpha]